MKGLVEGLLRLLAWLPLPVLRAFAAAGGLLGYALARPRRRVARTNLRLAYPHASPKEIERLTRAHFIKLMQALLDRAWLWYGPAETVRRRCPVRGMAHWSRERPTILLVPHLAGLDAALTALLQQGVPITGFYQKQTNPVFDAIVFEGRMRGGDLRAYSRDAGVRRVIADMKDGRPFYCLPDMDFGPKDSVYVPLFGVRAATLTVLPKLGRLGGAVVVPLIARMTPTGYDIRLEPAWEGIGDMDVEAACIQMNQAIERWALEGGPEYLWSHRRYKSRAPGDPPVYA